MHNSKQVLPLLTEPQGYICAPLPWIPLWPRQQGYICAPLPWISLLLRQQGYICTPLPRIPLWSLLTCPDNKAGLLTRDSLFTLGPLHGGHRS